MGKCGYYFSCAIDDTGVVCWGADVVESTPEFVAPTLVDIGEFSACVIDDNKLKCWERDTTSILLEQAVSDVRVLEVGYGQACLLDDDGVECVRFNNTSASDITDVPTLTKPVDLSVSRDYACAVEENNITCWGNVPTVPDLDVTSSAQGEDAFPLDPSEWRDTDGDGVGNNADTDDDNDGVNDVTDDLPLDPAESVDTDGDGIGNNADTDDDGDGVPDENDAFQLDPSESVDTDGDGIGNNADTDDDNDGIIDSADSFPQHVGLVHTVSTLSELRSALQISADNNQHNTISLAALTYELSADGLGPLIHEATAGNDLTIETPSGMATIDGGDSVALMRLMDSSRLGTITIRNVKLTNGVDADGAAVLSTNTSNVHLEGVIISENQGGVLRLTGDSSAGGVNRISNSRIENNTGGAI